MTVYIKSLCVKNWGVCQGGNAIPQFPKVDGIPAPRVTPMCLLLRDSDLASQPASLSLTSYPAADAAGLHLHKAACHHCSEPVCLLPPYLPSLLSVLRQLGAPGSTPQFWYTPWPSGLLVYLASEEQLLLSNSSLNLAQPLLPPRPELWYCQKWNPGSSSFAYSLGHILKLPCDGIRGYS